MATIQRYSIQQFDCWNKVKSGCLLSNFPCSLNCSPNCNLSCQEEWKTLQKTIHDSVEESYTDGITGEIREMCKCGSDYKSIGRSAHIRCQKHLKWSLSDSPLKNVCIRFMNDEKKERLENLRILEVNKQTRKQETLERNNQPQTQETLDRTDQELLNRVGQETYTPNVQNTIPETQKERRDSMCVHIMPEFFTNEIKKMLKDSCETLECPVCYMNMNESLVISSCGHKLCKKCYTEINKQPDSRRKCPECRKPFK